MSHLAASCLLLHFFQLQILLLIKQASILNVVATDLVWNKGLLSWLHFVADSIRYCFTIINELIEQFKLFKLYIRSILFCYILSFAVCCSDSNKLSLLCEIIHNIWSTVGRIPEGSQGIKEDTVNSDQLVDSKQKVHIPHIEHDMALLLLCLQQRLDIKNS